MARRGVRDLAVGTMFALALSVLALGVMAVGGETGWLFRKSIYYVVFPSADGLLVGAPVKMAGVTIGTVTKIRLPTDPNEEGICAEIAVDPDYGPRLREDSRAALRILQILTNEKYVEITPGREGQVLAPGSTIELQLETGMLERGALIAEDVGEITVSLKNILERLERGEGLLGQMLNDPEFGKAGLEALRKSLENVQALTEDMLRGKGTVGRLLQDESLAARIEDLGQAISDFAAVMKTAGGEQGTLTRVLGPDGPAERAAHELETAAAALRRVAEGLERGEGLAGRMLRESEYSAALAEDLRATARNLAEITAKINRGEGSLGALINERTLYDGAEEILAGVNDSRFARWLMRHYQKKGIENEGEPAEGEGD